MNFGSEQTIRYKDKSYRLGRLTIGVLESFRNYVAEVVGDPFLLAERFLGKIPAEESVRMVREAEAVARQLKQFSLSCPLAQEFMRTEAGMAYLYALMLRANHPEVTPDDALGMLQAMGEEQARVSLLRAQGDVPGNPPGPARPEGAGTPGAANP